MSLDDLIRRHSAADPLCQPTMSADELQSIVQATQMVVPPVVPPRQLTRTGVIRVSHAYSPYDEFRLEVAHDPQINADVFRVTCLPDGQSLAALRATFEGILDEMWRMQQQRALTLAVDAKIQAQQAALSPGAPYIQP